MMAVGNSQWRNFSRSVLMLWPQSRAAPTLLEAYPLGPELFRNVDMEKRVLCVRVASARRWQS